METATDVTPKPNRRNRIAQLITRIFAVIGVLATVYILAGLAVDIPAFDPTSGGYDYPYMGWVGTPIDYSPMYTTPDGMFSRGRVIDLHFNCRTGMISYNLLGIIRGDFREFSDRAKVVHQPQVACRERGFDTSAWDSVAGFPAP